MLTIGDLYSHRSGLPDHAGDKLEDLGYDRRYVLDRLRQLPLDPFRISYAYTNFGVTAAAEAVAQASGRPWEDLSEQVLYTPLGMTSTSSRFADYEARPDRAVGHIHVDGKYEPLYKRDADPEAPAGGVSSSVNDLTHWLTMVLANGSYNGRQIVDAKALLPALTPQSVSSPPSEPAMRSGFYGYGFNVGTTSAARMQFSHSGAFELGAGTNFVIIPSADVAIVALTNATPSGIPETLTAEFADLVQFGEVREDWRTLYKNAFAGMDSPVGELVGKQPPADPAPARSPASYAGTYANDYWGPATVAEKDGKLTLSMGPRPGYLRAEALGRRRFHLRLRQRELASRKPFQGHLRRRQAHAGVLRRLRDGDLHPMTVSMTAGLSDAEVAARIAEGKANDVPARASRSVSEIVRANVFTRINAILGVLFLLVLATGSLINGLFGLLIIANSGIGIIQELRAKKTLDNLAIVGQAKPMVRRQSANRADRPQRGGARRRDRARAGGSDRRGRRAAGSVHPGGRRVAADR